MTDLQRYLVERLALKREAYAAGNLGALQDALGLCIEYEQPLPEWAAEAIQGVLADQIQRKQAAGRGRQARWLNQYREDMRDFVRWDAVEEAREHGIPAESSYLAAHLLLEGNFGAGSERTIRNSCTRVRKRIKTDPYRYHLLESLRPPKPDHTHSDWKHIYALITTP